MASNGKKRKGWSAGPELKLTRTSPFMHNADDLKAWFRNHNAAIRSWAALTQCGMSMKFLNSFEPETAPYGQIVGWGNPTSVVDIRSDWNCFDPMWNGLIELTQASAQGFWDKYVACRDGLLPEDSWGYNPDRIARAELFGDPEAYLAAYDATSREEIFTAIWNFDGLLYFTLYDGYMDIVPRAEIQEFIQQSAYFRMPQQYEWDDGEI